jgi:hypothetical protein
VKEALDRRLFDRRLFLAAAIGFALIVFAGFARTYYAKAVFGTPPLPSGLVHLHGLLMTAWVVLFATQVRFISTKRIRLHQRLGYAGIGLAALIIASGVPTALRAAKFGSTAAPPDVPPLAFLIVPLTDLVMFALFFAGAVYYRRRPAAHKSLMLLTALNFLPPALARVPIPSLLALGPLWFFGVPTALALLCLALDARHTGHVNKVLLTGTLLLAASYIGRLALMNTAAWMGVATWMVGLV